MPVEFGRMRHSEIRQAAELATRAFDDYEYFTNWFPDKEERNRVQFAIIWREYKTNFGPAKYLVARQDGRLVAVAQLNPPTTGSPLISATPSMDGLRSIEKETGRQLTTG